MAIEITDQTSALGWLETQDHQTQIWFASRCALRAAPALGFGAGATLGGLAFASFRAMLISGVASTCPTPEMKAVSDSAISAAKSAADSADSAALSAAFSARSAAFSARSATDSAAESAALSARSAALSARSATDSATFSAAETDANYVGTWVPLWPGDMPEGLVQGWGNLSKFMAAEPETWGFWQSWYTRILNGDPVDWDLCLTIVKSLSEVDWDKGPEHVAARIREIEADHEPRPASVPEVETETLTRHVTRLLQNPEMTALAAEGAAELLERAIADFLSGARDVTNRLPDELQHLDYLPAIFRRIAVLVKSSEHADSKTAKLVAEIEALNDRVAALEADLAVARRKTLDGRFKGAVVKAAGQAFGASLVGGAAFATAHFFGFDLMDATLENLRGWTSEIKDAAPLPDTLPPTTDV